MSNNPSGPERAPVNVLKGRARDSGIRRLAKYRAPDGTPLYTQDHLATIFHTTTKTVGEKLTKAGIYRQPPPNVRHGELPENESAYFLGLALGDFQVDQVHWGRERFVVVATESKDLARRRLLAVSLGTWGEIHEETKGVKVYVDPLFDFMLEPEVSGRFLDAKSRFAPFLLGAMTARLSRKGHRLSLPNRELLERIHGKFSEQFKFSMGNYNVEHRPAWRGRKDSDIPVITVAKPEEVYGSLIKVKNVQTLPFLADVARLSL